MGVCLCGGVVPFTLQTTPSSPPLTHPGARVESATRMKGREGYEMDGVR